MSTLTTNFSLSKAVDADNAEVYLATSLAAALDSIDTLLKTVTGGFTVATGNLVVTAGNLTVTAGNLAVSAGTAHLGASGGGVSLSTSSVPPASGVLIGGTNAATAGTLSLGTHVDAVGGGAAATLGTIGGTGPVTSTQNQWLRIGIGNGNYWIPVWL